MKRKNIASILTLALFILSLAVSALAAPGDALIFDREWKEQNISENANMKDMVIAGDTLYVLFNTRLYSYQLGAEEPTLLVDFLPGKEGRNLQASSQRDQMKAELGDKASLLISKLLLWQNQLYGLNLTTWQMVPLQLGTGVFELEKAIQLPFRDDLWAEEKGLDNEDWIEKEILALWDDELFL